MRRESRPRVALTCARNSPHQTHYRFRRLLSHCQYGDAAHSPIPQRQIEAHSAPIATIPETMAIEA